MGIEASISEATGKVSSHTPVVSSPEESDGVIVPEKSANKGKAIPAESIGELGAALLNQVGETLR